MRQKIILLAVSLFFAINGFSTGEPSTYFNIYVPPNNDWVQRDVCLIVTAIFDSTSFQITDDGMDGDTDDSVTGILMAGQSYILYIRDNGINDDAKYASGGTLTQDGDYFIIESDKIVYASQSTNSDWQHDWVPSVNKTSLGEKFIIYAPKISYSNRDVNVFAYEDDTQVTFRKISNQAKTNTGYTDVDMNFQDVIFQREIDRGEDLIHKFADGKNCMVSGETYVIESSKPITVMYGSLYQNGRDGGGYVPASSGTASGELFYFAVPYQANGEQEIRIVSWNDGNSVVLERYNNGSWIQMSTWNVDRLSAVDWVGKNNGNVTYPTVFRVTCSSGKKVSVFEANWLETGSFGTSDIASMLTSENGTCAGKQFLAYMAPPGNEHKVRDPFTGQLFGQRLTHVYLFAGQGDTAHVTVKDAYTNGSDLSRSYTILPGRYADCYLTESEWKAIYNGTGSNSGPERPYLLIESDSNISVMNTNFNDNWMMYFGSSLAQSFSQTSSSSTTNPTPGDTVTITSTIVFNTNSTVTETTAEVVVGSGSIPVSSEFNDITNNTTTVGTIEVTEDNSTATFTNLPDLDPANNYEIETKSVMHVTYNNGTIMPDNTVVSVETVVTGEVDGVTQQSVSSEGLSVQTSNTTNLMFSEMSISPFTSDLSDSWSVSWIDYNNDNQEDLFITDKSGSNPGMLYKNNANSTFTKTYANPLTSDIANTVASIWADIDNDSDLDALLINDTQKPNMLYLNDGSGQFSQASLSGLTADVGYYHSGSWTDYDNDGYVDLFLSNYMPTRFNKLYHNNGDGTFEEITTGSIVSEAYISIGASWGDYNNDGFMDLFIPNGDGENNTLFTNNGDKTFTKITVGDISNDGGNSVASCWGDMNNDGYVDLFVANASNQVNFLYQNNTDGTFTKITLGSIITDQGDSHGCSWVDMDNDGDLDLYVNNDTGSQFIYLNDGVGNFIRHTNELPASSLGKCFSNAWGDFDKDGFMDLSVATHSGEANFLFKNNGNSNHYINIKLVGTISNKSAIGSRVSVKSNGIWQIREVQSQSGFGGQSSIRSHFGLGGATSIDSIMVLWPSGHTQTVTSLNVDNFITITEENASIVNGSVFHDTDGNCAIGEGEENLSGIKVTLSPGDQYTSTDDNGDFTIHLPAGSYQATIENTYWQNNCSPVAFTVVGIGNTTSGVDIPASSVADGPELSVTVASTALRRGFRNNLLINYANNGTQSSSNDTITVTFNQHVIPLSSSIPWSEKIGNTCKWFLSSTSMGEQGSIEVIDSVALSATIGQSITTSVSISTPQNDLNSSNNSFSFTDEVVGAIDPNDLTVSPRGLGDEGYISRHDTLIYRIRFQNVGTYYASRVVITDELPQNADYNSLKMISVSHRYTYEVTGEGKITWIFNDINLPDSTMSEPESHGYIFFSILPDEFATDGTKLPNQAEIVFDYEDPLPTNPVNNTIQTLYEDNNGNVLIAPNPVTSIARLSIQEEGQNQRITSYRILTVTGRSVLEKSNLLDYHVPFHKENLSSGIYFITAIDEYGRNYMGRMVIL